MLFHVFDYYKCVLEYLNFHLFLFGDQNLLQLMRLEGVMAFEVELYFFYGVICFNLRWIWLYFVQKIKEHRCHSTFIGGWTYKPR